MRERPSEPKKARPCAGLFFAVNKASFPAMADPVQQLTVPLPALGIRIRLHLDGLDAGNISSREAVKPASQEDQLAVPLVRTEVVVDERRLCPVGAAITEARHVDNRIGVSAAHTFYLVEPAFIGDADLVDSDVHAGSTGPDTALAGFVQAALVKFQFVPDKKARPEQARRRQTLPQANGVQVGSVGCVADGDVRCSGWLIRCRAYGTSRSPSCPKAPETR